MCCFDISGLGSSSSYAGRKGKMIHETPKAADRQTKVRGRFADRVHTMTGLSMQPIGIKI
jgi:hypothetical protein